MNNIYKFNISPIDFLCRLWYTITTRIQVYDCDMGKRFYKPPKMVSYRVFSVVFLFPEVFLFMNEKLALEIFGYLGTGLVLISFIMKDIKWLRAVNMSGGLISLIYAICTNAMPVVVLNASLIVINGIQLARILLNEKKQKKAVVSEDFVAYNKKKENLEEDI